MTVWFNHPPHNYVDAEVVDALDEFLRRLETDESVGAVVLAGRPDGQWFTHFDVAEILAEAQTARRYGLRPSQRRARALMGLVRVLCRIPGIEQGLRRTPAGGLVTLRRLERIYERMLSSNKAFVAAIDGLAFGAGFSIAMACDVRLLADSDHPFGLPEPVLDFFPVGPVRRMARTIGDARTIELLLECSWFPPKAAAEIGLVSRVVPVERLIDEAQATAARLARRAPATVRSIKQAVYGQGSYRRLRADLAFESVAFLATSSAPRALETMEGFVNDAQGDGLADETALLNAWRQARDRSADQR
ncbi:MAG: enoyl-CoA hydratase/isomerase family protein [Solirubrobacterales bacterium]